MVRNALRQSTIVPLSFLLGLLLIGSVSVAGFLILIVGNKAGLIEARSAIHSEISRIKETEKHLGISAVITTIDQSKLAEENTFVYGVFARSGEQVAGNLKDWDWEEKVSSFEELSIIEVPHSKINLSTASQRPFAGYYDVLTGKHYFDDGYVLFVGRNIDELEAASWIATTLGWAVIGVMLLTLIYVGWVSHYVSNSVRRFSRTARRISTTGDLSLRINQDSRWHDLGQLAETWNSMLDEIQILVSKIQNASNNIAHDLRTPLTRMRFDIERIQDVSLRGELTKEADTLLAMINGLLRIVEIETHKQRSSFKEIYLDRILEDVVLYFTPVAEEKAITLKTDLKSISYFGDRDLLFQSFLNVLDNAIKFTPNEGTVSIVIERCENGCVVSILDSGPGVPEGLEEAVFDRFYRIDESRGTPGYGLGLSIVAAVAEMHGFDVKLANNFPGVRVDFVFPLLSA